MSMTNEQKHILQLVEKFIEQKGRGSCYCFPPLKAENIIISFINLHRQKRTDTKIFILVRDITYRTKLVELLKKYNLNNNVTILTKTYFNANYKYEYYFTFTIGIEDLTLLQHLNKHCKFMFNIFLELKLTGLINDFINKVAPIIRTNISNTDIIKDRNKLPVEEMHIPINISEEDFELSQKYDKYLAASMSIFGSFENADKCRVGDSALNISAGQFRYNLALENGWNERLDTSIEFNAQIDNIYNPNSLLERANTLYNIIRERSKLLTDNSAKLPAIVDIIRKHPNQKILIVSKRGEFANEIANYINDTTEYLCGEYHTEIPSQYIKDENGNTITYKSGENKGKAKLFKAKALSTMSLNRFNSTDKSLEINILSIKNSSDTELKTAINVVIFTSSVCLTPNEFITRFSNIEFKDTLYSYVLYCNNSAESVKIHSRFLTDNVKLIEEQKSIEINAESGEVYL